MEKLTYEQLEKVVADLFDTCKRQANLIAALTDQMQPHQRAAASAGLDKEVRSNGFGYGAQVQDA